MSCEWGQIEFQLIRKKNSLNLFIIRIGQMGILKFLLKGKPTASVRSIKYRGRWGK